MSAFAHVARPSVWKKNAIKSKT
ncbi:hypothetical protein EMIT0P253_460020 [Pseudomonas sp. IT-P253]